MMTIKSKSIRALKDVSDGIRICVMRRLGKGMTDFDVWLPALAPSVTLLCHEHTDEKCHRRLLIEKLSHG